MGGRGQLGAHLIAHPDGPLYALYLSHNTLGEAGVNIANFQLGRSAKGGDAIALLYVDGPVSDEILAKVQASDKINTAKYLKFAVAAE